MAMLHKIFCRKRRKQLTIENPNVVGRGKILLSHSRGHDTIIIFFQDDGHRDEHIKLLSKTFGFR